MNIFLKPDEEWVITIQLTKYTFLKYLRQLTPVSGSSSIVFSHNLVSHWGFQNSSHSVTYAPLAMASYHEPYLEI